MEAIGLPVIGTDGEILVRHDIEVEEESGFDAAAFVVSANVRRRHLSGEQKRDLITKLLQANPERSDRATAKIADVDGKTIASVRADLEGRAEIPHVDTRVDSKGRQQPVKKPPELAPSRRRRRPAAELQPTRSPTQKRDKAIDQFSDLLHRRTADTLDDLTRLLHGERARIAELPLQKRVHFAREYLAALAVKLDALQQRDVPQRDVLSRVDRKTETHATEMW
jgi:hypothetical protein